MARRPVARVKLNTRLLPILVGLLLVMQLIAPYRGFVILLVGLGGAWLIAFLWARSLAHGLKLTREMRYGWAQVGDLLEERFTLEQEGTFPALLAEVVDYSTMPGYQAGRGTSVGSRSTTRWTKKATCARRGLFTLGPTRVLSGDPFGFYTISLHYPASVPFVVMPPIVSLPSIQVSPGGRAGEGRPRPNAADRTVSVSSVREYAPGDSLRWIHWPTSAHRDAFFVRLFEGTPAGDWWILLDLEERVQVGKDEDSTVEHGVILAASLADQGLCAARGVGLAMHGEDLVWMPPKEGDPRRWEILRALALASPGARSLSEMLAHMGGGLGHHASLVIITPAASGDWIEALVPLLRRDVTPTVLLLDPASFGGHGDVRGTGAMLSHMGVTHYVITRDLLDRAEARPGQRGHWEWRVSGTGRAIPIRRPGDVSWKVMS